MLYLPTKSQISPTCSSYSPVKYHNIGTGEPGTKFLHTADLLSESEETSTNVKSIFESLKNLIQNQLQLDLADLKAFVSDGASVMTDREQCTYVERTLCLSPLSTDML